MIKKMLLFFLCFTLFLSMPGCKKKLPTSPDIPTEVLPTITSFTANPTSIARGGTSVLSWSTTNATSISINQGVGNVSATGTVEVSPEETTAYTLTATNSDGSKTQSCTIEVVLNLPIIDYFTATPTSILAGEWSTLSWSVQPEGLTEALRIEPLGNLTIPFTGVHPVSPAETTTYTLIATNNDGQTTSSCTVSVTAQACFELTNYSYGYTSYGCCEITGIVKNVGNVTGYNVGIEFQAYNASDVIIDTAHGFPAGLGNIPVGVSAAFDAVFFEVYDWAIIAKVTYEITWLTAQGMRLTQTGIVPFK